VASIVSRFRTSTKDVVDGLDLDLGDRDDLLFYGCLIQRGEGFQAAFPLDNFASVSASSTAIGSRYALLCCRVAKSGCMVS
jgi:hypothetical protein